MYEAEKCEVLKTALQIRENRLVSLSGGNVSLRVGEDRYLVTPSGMDYDSMTPEDICMIDGDGRLLEGCRKPSSDWAALVYMFRHMPKINAIIHTHQPWATAAGFVTQELPEFLVTVIDACHDPVKVAPFTPSSDIGMGILAVEYASDALAVILKHHGVLAYGDSLRQALYSAVYLEESAKTYVLARAMGAEIPPIAPELIRAEKEGWQHYGQ